MNHPKKNEIDAETGQPFSAEFIAARRRGWDAQRAARTARGEARAALLAEAAWEILEADRQRYRESRRRAQEAEALAAPFEAAIERVVGVLRDRGPMTGTELEALRLPALSKNSVRPTLRAAEERGSVRRERSGRRVLWIAV